MKTSYLLRQCTWMNTDERRVARYTARRAEQAISVSGTTLNPAHACAIFAHVTAFAMYQRMQASFAEILGQGGDLSTLGIALEHTQTAFLRAQDHLEKITARANGIALPEHPESPAPKADTTPGPVVAALPAPTGAKPFPEFRKTFATLDERRRRRNANKAARKR